MAVITGGACIRHGRPLWYALIALVLMRFTTLGAYPLMDTTEARYAEIARKMLELGDWVTPWADYGVPFWAKPPLSFWLTAASYSLFGVNEFAARLPHFAAGVAVAWLTWDLAKRRSQREPLIAVALLAGSLLFIVSAGAVMTDMLLALATTLVMRGFWLGLHGATAERNRERWLLFIGIGLGLLAKGPVVLVLAGLPIVLWALLARRFRATIHGLPWVRGSLLGFAIGLPWYLVAEFRTPGFLEYFLIGEHWQRFVTPGWQGDLYGSAHEYPRGTIWLFALAAVLPWPLLLPFAPWRRNGRTVARNEPGAPQWHLYLTLFALAPCIFFTAAGNVLIAYVLPGLPAAALLGAEKLASDENASAVDRLITTGLLIVLLGGAAAVAALNASPWYERKSVKGLVADYERKRASSEPLIFLGQKPCSAAFYTKGRAEQVIDPVQLAARLANTPAFVAMTSKQLFTRELQQWLERVSDHGPYVLYAPRQRR